MKEIKRTFFDTANSIDDVLNIIKNSDVFIEEDDEVAFRGMLNSLNKLRGTSLEDEFIDFIHIVEEYIAVTSTKYFRPNLEKHILTIGCVARCYTDSYEKFKSYTNWQQILLALFFRGNANGVLYDLFSNEVMNKIVGLDGPTKEEMAEYREFIFSQIYRKNVCRKGQIEFLLGDEVDIQKVYDIIGFPPKKKDEISLEDKEKVIDILLTRGPEESPICTQVKKCISSMLDLDILCSDMSYEERLDFVNTHSREEIEKLCDEIDYTHLYL